MSSVIRFLVTGAVGCLGHQVVRQAQADGRFKVVAAVRRSDDPRLKELAPFAPVVAFDVSNKAQIRAALYPGFDVIINCTGIIKQRQFDPINAISVNSLAPHLLAKAATEIGARLIHVSTDCVFSGREGMYSEDAIPDPVDLYGRSKLLGEVTYDGHLTIRTSFIGPELTSSYGLLEWFLAQQGDVPGFSRAYWSGLTSIALARILLLLARRPDVMGLLHVAGERVDKFTLLRKIKRVYDRHDVRVYEDTSVKVDRSLDNTLFTGLQIPCLSLDEMLAELAGTRGCKSK